MIKNVVFDIGMVLKGWHPQLDKFFGADTAGKVENAIWGSGLWTEFDRGIIPENELIDRMVSLEPEHEKEIRYILGNLGLISERYDYSIGWINELKEKGYGVYYLSNYSRIMRDTVPETIDFIPYMDGGIYSCDVGLLKPDRRIYELLCEKYGLKACECLFIDDRQENVDGAINAGMQSVRFESYEESYKKIMAML